MINFIRRWIHKKNLNNKINTSAQACEHFYQTIASFHIAKQARSEQKLFSYEYIYGEINLFSLAKLLSQCNIKPGSIFYDLGSGSGKAVVFSALLHEFKQACGIEQLQLLDDCAQMASRHFQGNNIKFYQGDFLNHPWQDANIILVNAATYTGDFWQRVLQQLKLLRTDSQIIVISKQLPSDTFKLIFEDILPMSWGMSRASVYTVVRP